MARADEPLLLYLRHRGGVNRGRFVFQAVCRPGAYDVVPSCLGYTTDMTPYR